jgi:hypothetical protein
MGRSERSGQVLTGYSSIFDRYHRAVGVDSEGKRLEMVNDAFRRGVSAYMAVPDGDKLIVVTPKFKAEVVALLNELECEIVELPSS